MNFFGILFVRKDRKDCVNDTVINHEKIHTAQMREMLFVFFYVWYVLEWFVKFFVYGDFHKAYSNLSFEREAYANEKDARYLDERGSYIWFKYILKKGGTDYGTRKS